MYLLKSIPRALGQRCFSFLMREALTHTLYRVPCRGPCEAKERDFLSLSLALIHLSVFKCTHVQRLLRTGSCLQLVRTNCEWRQTNQTPPWGFDLFTLFSALFKPSCVKAGVFFSSQNLWLWILCKTNWGTFGRPVLFPLVSPYTHWNPLNAPQCGHNEDDAVLAQPFSNGSRAFY